MDLAICHPNVIPGRGGCERYIADLARYLVADGHAVHVYASRWDQDALPDGLRYHAISEGNGPRFLKPWRFSAACRTALAAGEHDLSLGFDKVVGVDVQYPLGGLHAANHAHNLRKHRGGFVRALARLCKLVDPTYHSYCGLERRQYPAAGPPFLIANSEFVRGHFERYYSIPRSQVAVLHCAIDPDRFSAADRPARRNLQRERWGLSPSDTVALFVAMNYGLKGLDPLLHAVRWLPSGGTFKLVVVGSPKTAGYRRLARRLGVEDRVLFHGFSADPRDAFFASDLLVHPTFYDPCSLVVLEARACGLPVVTSRFNGAAELLDPPHDGLVIDDPHDDVSLAAAVGAFLDPARRPAAARAALHNSRQWTWDRHYRDLLKLLREAAARKRAA